jgi:hypothetical protein
MTSIDRLSVYKNSRTKIIVIITSIILLSGMLFVPAKQIEQAYAQANVPISQPQGSMDQVANQIAQMVAKYNPGANTLAISKILVDIYTQTMAASSMVKASDAIIEINAYASKFTTGHVPQALIYLGKLVAANNLQPVTQVEAAIAQQVRAGGSAAEALVQRTVQIASGTTAVNPQLSLIAQNVAAATGTSQVAILQVLQQIVLQTASSGGGTIQVQKFVTNIKNSVAKNPKHTSQIIGGIVKNEINCSGNNNVCIIKNSQNNNICDNSVCFRDLVNNEKLGKVVVVNDPKLCTNGASCVVSRSPTTGRTVDTIAGTAGTTIATTTNKQQPPSSNPQTTTITGPGSTLDEGSKTQGSAQGGAGGRDLNSKIKTNNPTVSGGSTSSNNGGASGNVGGNLNNPALSSSNNNPSTSSSSSKGHDTEVGGSNSADNNRFAGGNNDNNGPDTDIGSNTNNPTLAGSSTNSDVGGSSKGGSSIGESSAKGSSGGSPPNSDVGGSTNNPTLGGGSSNGPSADVGGGTNSPNLGLSGNKNPSTNIAGNPMDSSDNNPFTGGISKVGSSKKKSSGDNSSPLASGGSNNNPFSITSNEGHSKKKSGGGGSDDSSPSFSGGSNNNPLSSGGGGEGHSKKKSGGGSDDSSPSFGSSHSSKGSSDSGDN